MKYKDEALDNLDGLDGMLPTEVHDIADSRYDGRIQKYQQGLTR